ncbi:MAG: MBL fold metallo-hydrolase RNA specificity domain-containing protein, partial [Bacteroidota bacterium]|nr:MBL fold metallo-hydrolase RNA specificity domain-containing protein [Bacteroidota bacterium]
NTVRQHLQEIFHSDARQKGVLLIPAFSVGRTQEVLFHLNELANAGELPPMPIFVDSPLADEATQAFRTFLPEFNTTVQHLLMTDSDPFDFPQLRFTHSVEESKAILRERPPYAVIAGSAMCESGRILHHLKRHIGNRRTTILFVGFSAAHTLGRRLVEGEKRVRIFGDSYTVRARVLELPGLSAHADGDDLLRYFRLLPTSTSIALVHGEPSRQEILRRQLQQCGFERVLVPQSGEWLRL